MEEKQSNYQRFSFDNLPPERQIEIAEKQRQQRIQREYLEEQIKLRKEGNEPKAKFPSRASVEIPESKFAVASDTSNILFPDLQKRRFSVNEKMSRSMSHNPSSIHDSFNNLRHKIRSSAAAAVLKPK